MIASTAHRHIREAELSRLFRLASAGESVSLVGVSGVGKSNLFNLLLEPYIQGQYLGEDAERYIFVRTNFHYLPDVSARSVLSLLLEPFELLEKGQSHPRIDVESIEQIRMAHDGLIDAGEDVLKVLRYFKLGINSVLAGPDRRLLFLLDQFDEVYRSAHASVFSILRGLREAFKYRISFFVFTRLPLQHLAIFDSGREEFNELLAPGIVWIRPYARQDTFRALENIASRHQVALDDGHKEEFYRMSGGHAGLMRAAFLQDLYPERRSANEEAPGQPTQAIETECLKIWECLELDEKRLLAYISQGIPLNDEDRSSLAYQYLRAKGMLSETGDVFSPLLEGFVRRQEALWERSLYLDVGLRQVWVMGRQAQGLTSLEFRLFRCLYERPGEVVIKDEMVEAGWPGAQGGVSDAAVATAVSRLRKKIEPDPDNPRFIITLRDQGYQLNPGLD